MLEPGERLTGSGDRRGGPLLPLMLAATLALAGVILMVVAVAWPAADRPRPPLPSAAPITGAAAPAVAWSPVQRLPRSVPVRVDIPRIGVSSSLLILGLNADHTMQVPPLERRSRAGWYRYSPTPGEVGPSVIVGHVDSAAYGPAVFFRIGELRPGDTVEVTRADHLIAVFRVRAVASYPKARFPTQTVYGNTNQPELRLITCGGAFDPAARSYENNIVVYADLVGSRSAR